VLGPKPFFEPAPAPHRVIHPAVWGPEMRPDSDLDLAVEGLPRGKLVFAHARLSSQTLYTVDLVLLERLPELLRNRILKSGIIVYGEQS